MKQATSYITLIRPLDWIKNVFIFATLFFTPTHYSLHNVGILVLAFVCFSVAASCIYILNDIKDRKADRLHPEKKHRPIASKRISVSDAMVMWCIFLIVSLVGSFYLSRPFFWCVLLYLVINHAYCFYLKRFSLIDVYVIAIGFLIRVIAGSVIMQLAPSVWLLTCTGLLALFLGFGKRRDDVVHEIHGDHRKSIKGYNLPFLDAVLIIIIAALFIAYVIYTTLVTTTAHLGTSHYYITVPIVLFGILRYLQIIFVEKRSGSPTKLIYNDQQLAITAVLWIVVSAVLLYG